MLYLSIFCMLLALTVAQYGYDYNKPNRPFGARPSSNRPGSLATTPYPTRPHSDDFGGPATGYPSLPPNYSSSSQRPGYPASSYPDQDSNGLSETGNSPGGPGRNPNTNSNYPQGNRGPSSGDHPGQSDSTYSQGSRNPSNGFSGQGSRFPEQGQNYPGQPGSTRSNFGNEVFPDDGHYVGGDYSAIPGDPDIDYPILSYVPLTNFHCEVQQYPGYYADVETRCQVFHVCANNKTYDFLCPNGTIFSQEEFVCVWWNQFECESAPRLYDLNAKIYDYSIHGSSDFLGNGPNDYSRSRHPGGGPQGPYQGNGGSRPSNNYPGNSGKQGPTTPLPSSYPGQDNGYPSSNGPSDNYSGNQSPSGNYPGSQRPSGNYPDYTDSGSYSFSDSGSTPYPGNGSANQGYPSSRPSGTDFSGGNSGRNPQKPNREYLPPRNKRTKHSKH